MHACITRGELLRHNSSWVWKWQHTHAMGQHTEQANAVMLQTVDGQQVQGTKLTGYKTDRVQNRQLA
jgi:hypothetical protein